MFESDILLPFL